MNLPRLLATIVLCQLVAALDPSAQVPCESGSLQTGYGSYAISVALSGPDRMAVGQTYNGFDTPGSVLLYRREAWGWEPDGVVHASDAESYDDFGYSVALEGDRLIVGAIAIGDLGARGSGYIFERQGDGDWLETAKLFPNLPQAWAIGWSVALDGDRAVVGAAGSGSLGPGHAYVYEIVGGSWMLTQELTPSFSVIGDRFGRSVALDGDRIVVGASYQNFDQGWAFVFENQGGAWSETAVLTGSSSAPVEAFGTAVALQGDTLLVSAPYHANPPSSGNISGAIFCFERQGGVWTETQTLWMPELLGVWSNLGNTIDLDGDRFVTGAYKDKNFGEYFGSGLLFERAAGVWTNTAYFAASGLEYGASFGYSVALDGEDLVIGAPGVITGSTGPGSAHTFQLNSGPHLTADTGSLSLSAGGTQTLDLGACLDHVGDLFVVAGSASGTSPGFAFAGQPVPLNPDVYFLHTVNHVGAPPLAGAFGTFDSFGRGEASFTLPAGSSPSLAGLVLHHAYAVLNGATWQLSSVSDAVELALVP